MTAGMPRSLELLEGLRARRHRAARQEFMACQAAVSNMQARLAELEADFARQCRRMRQAVLGGGRRVGGDWAAQSRDFQAARALLQRQLDEACEALEGARGGLIDANRQHEAVRLAARRRAADGLSLRRLRETAESDDLHSARLASDRSEP